MLLAGNYGIKDVALKNRLKEIKFPNISKENKRKITLKHIIPQLLKLYSLVHGYSLHQEDFTREDWATIDRIIEEDTDMGWRTIQIKITSFFEAKLKENYLKYQQQQKKLKTPRVYKNSHRIERTA